MAESKVSGLTLGATIAFVAPGFVALNALALHSNTAREWVSGAAEKEQGVGLFLFVALASLALGVIVSGVRALLLEKLCTARFWWGKGAIELPVVDYSRLRDEKALEAFEAINEHYYRYYLFYANMCVALLLLIASHIAAASEQAWSWPLFALLGVTLV